MARNWGELGIVWIPGTVSRRRGKNDSDKIEIGVGPIPQLSDVDLAIKADLADSIMAGVNGTSWRVTAQDVIRAYVESNRDSIKARQGNLPDATDVEELRERIFSRLKGMRSGGSNTRTVFVAPLPNGERWTGTDVTEYEQLYFAALMDAGMDADTALGVAVNVAKALR